MSARHTILVSRSLLETDVTHFGRDNWLALVEAAECVLSERDNLESQVEQLLEGTRADTAEIAGYRHTLSKLAGGTFPPLAASVVGESTTTTGDAA